MTVRPTVMPVAHMGASPYAPLTPQQVASNLRPLTTTVAPTTLKDPTCQ